MAKVYDFSSRKQIKTNQNMDANDLAAEGGRYVGNIGKQNAKAFRSVLEMFEHTLERFLDVQEELEEYAALHEEHISFVERTLKTDMDVEQEEMMVSEEGHVWIVPFREEDEN